MLAQLLQWFNAPQSVAQVGTPQTALEEPVVKEFVDLDLDLMGWYAIGHQDKAQFLNTITRHQPWLRSRSIEVEHGWALFQNSSFEQLNYPFPGSIPITLVLVNDTPFDLAS